MVGNRIILQGDYNITQAGTSFRVDGAWPGEVMGLKKDGTAKDNCLYKPGDVFIVPGGMPHAIGEGANHKECILFVIPPKMHFLLQPGRSRPFAACKPWLCES